MGEDDGLNSIAQGRFGWRSRRATAGIGLLPAEAGGYRIEERDNGFAELHLPPDAAAELIEALRPTAGVYPITKAPGGVVEIVKSLIRDPDGEVVAEIG